MLLDDEQIQELFKTSRVIAMVGLSPDEEKPSNTVARYLKDKGYRVIPVNPAREQILGEKSYKSLGDIPEKVDIVDLFIRSENVLPFVREALKLNPRAIWLQLDIKNAEARELVSPTEIGYVEDRCVKREHEKLAASRSSS